MHVLEREKLLENVLRRMEQDFLLVEGKNDCRAINYVMPAAECLACVCRPEASVSLALEACNGRLFALLFDFDGEGERKARVFEERLLAEGAGLDRPLRLAFKAVFGVRTLEEFPAALLRVRQEIREERSRGSREERAKGFKFN